MAQPPPQMYGRSVAQGEAGMQDIQVLTEEDRQALQQLELQKKASRKDRHQFLKEMDKNITTRSKESKMAHREEHQQRRRAETVRSSERISERDCQEQFRIEREEARPRLREDAVALGERKGRSGGHKSGSSAAAAAARQQLPPPPSISLPSRAPAPSSREEVNVLRAQLEEARLSVARMEVEVLEIEARDIAMASELNTRPSLRSGEGATSVNPTGSGFEAELQRLEAQEAELRQQIAAQRRLAAGEGSAAATERTAEGTAAPGTAAVGSTSGAATPGPAKGKGKGKGPPAPPKAPPKAPPAKPSAPGGFNGGLPRKSRLQSLHWKVLSQPPGEEAATTARPHFHDLQRLLDALAPPDSTPVAAEERERKCVLLPSEGGLSSWETVLAAPERWQTVFASPPLPPANKGSEAPPLSVRQWQPATKEMSAPVLLEYFKVRDAAVKVDASKEEGGEKALLDGKRIQMLGIMFKKFVFANKGTTEHEAVFSLKRAMLQCDYGVMKQEFLPLIRQVLRHEADGNKVSKYVSANGEAALAHLPQSEYHRFVHELLKVPQVDERLECMMLEMVYDETLEKIRNDVAVLRDALSVIEAKGSLLRSFFATAHRLGQGLNRDSRATQAQRGFQLRTLQKLAQTKSPRSPKHSILHFALALLSPNDARQLFSAKDVAALRKASALGSFNVYQDCLLAVQGLEDVREICETGTFTVRSTGAQVKIERRRKTMATSRKAGEGVAAGGAGEVEAPIDVDDCFHERMRVFVESRLDDARAVALACYRVFQRYKDVALFLDDLGFVYPPPRDDRDPSRCDLFVALYKLAEDIRTHSAEVDRDHLRELLDTSSGLPS